MDSEILRFGIASVTLVDCVNILSVEDSTSNVLSTHGIIDE